MHSAESRVHNSQTAPWQQLYWPSVLNTTCFWTGSLPKCCQCVLQTDRIVTPWLILLVHAPWYSTYASHFKENDCMREGYEPLVTQYGVDIMVRECYLLLIPELQFELQLSS